MKKIILLLSIVALVSCSKEYSIEKRCGTIAVKHAAIGEHYNIYVSYGPGSAAAFSLTKQEFDNLKEGDQYCK